METRGSRGTGGWGLGHTPSALVKWSRGWWGPGIEHYLGGGRQGEGEGGKGVYSPFQQHSGELDGRHLNNGGCRMPPPHPHPPMSILRNGNVACLSRLFLQCYMSNLRNDYVPRHYILRPHVACH